MGGSYPAAEVLLPYSTAPANWAIPFFAVIMPIANLLIPLKDNFVMFKKHLFGDRWLPHLKLFEKKSKIFIASNKLPLYQWNNSISSKC